ncbi:MAG TPA: hemerythrin domain-containing protein [Pyrinomonadaceae bacterium]|jgi:iron-sulfur cluster repair protein YtfE (RIC family)|nr:hemerythrin domain-containing protein [Pyrinomonadaceae bacterium]
MNAIELLKQDHDFVDGLFKQIEDTPPSRHAAIFKKVKNELDTHAHIEEKIFYPTLKKEGDKELQDITSEGIEEHRQIKKFLREIARSTSTEKREAKLKVLIEDTRHHVKEEEDEMFPMVDDQFSSEHLNALGDRMQAEKVKFQKAKRIPARREQPKGMVTKMVEKAKEIAVALTGGGDETQAPAKGRSRGTGKGASSSASRSSNGKSNGSAKASATSAKTSAGSNGSARSRSKAGSAKSTPAKSGSSSKRSGKTASSR